MKRTILSILSFSLIGIEVFAQTAIPNAGFEDWQTLQGPISNTYEEPYDWNSANECTAIVNQFSVNKSTDSHSGTYSAELESKSTSFQGIIANGVLTTATMICLAQGGGQEGGMAFPAFPAGIRSYPDSIVGWYKYAPAGNDSAYSQIMFLANNDLDTVCFTRIDFHAAANWTRFSAAICPGNNSSPEKLSLLFSSSWGDGSQGQAVVGSIFHIDDIEFIYPLDIGVGDELEANKWSVYPNPVIGELNINVAQGQEAHIEILDVTGKRIKYVKLSDERISIDLSTLVAGVYLYQIKSLENQVLRTGKLLVNP